MKTGQRVTVACCSLVALMLLVASSPLGGLARSAAFVGIQPESPALRHYFISAVSFRPLAVDTEVYLRSANHLGCLYTNPDGTVIAPVLLPEGSIVKYITLYYMTMLDDIVIAQLAVIDHEFPMGTTYFGAVESLPEEAEGSATSTELSIPIDMSSQSYAIEAQLIWVGMNPSLCGVRIDYIPPSIFAIALPHVAR